MAAEEKKESENDKDPKADGGGDGEGKSKKKSKKKLIIIAAGIVVLLIAVAAGLFFTGIIGKKPAASQEHGADGNGDKKPVDKTPKVVYFDLDEFIVNLSKVGGQPSFLKMAITLELVGEENVDKIGQKMPLVRDTFQVYLRELRADDLQGSAGIYRLRQELLLRLNKLMYPVKINDILFREILVQ